MHEKYQVLLEVIEQYNKVGVCLSGGSSSALVAIAARDALGAKNVIAITADTPFFTGEEMSASKDLTDKIGIRLLTPKANLLDDKDVVANGEDRCYFCKKALMAAVKTAAAESVDVLLDGSTSLDGKRDEPGERVLNELGVVCPLRLAGITKDEVKVILKELGMSYYIQPENACLATRIAIGEPITLKKLRWIRAAENFIRSLGFDLVRVRTKEGNARVEVRKEEVAEILMQKELVESELLAMGFKSVVIDEEGYKREAASCL